MALILNIDTSTSVCSVALARDGKMIALKENNEKNKKLPILYGTGNCGN